MQVISESVGKALQLTRITEMQGTAEFVLMFDKFFDLLNVSNFTNGTRYNKEFQHPYRHKEDKRLNVSFICVQSMHTYILAM